MEPGYLSNTAVKDLLAVKEGEIIHLKNSVLDLQKQVIDLQKQLLNRTCSCKS
jgi:hypothetical protein